MSKAITKENRTVKEESLDNGWKEISLRSASTNFFNYHYQHLDGLVC